MLGKYNMSSSVLCSTKVLTLPFIHFDPFYTKAFLWTNKRNFSNYNIVSRHKRSKTICQKWTSEKLLIRICSWLVAKQRCSPFDFCNTRVFFWWVSLTNVHDSTFRKIEQEQVMSELKDRCVLCPVWFSASRVRRNSCYVSRTANRRTHLHSVWTVSLCEPS